MKSNKLILKSQQRFRIEKHKVFTEKVNKIALSDDKRVQPIDSVETEREIHNENLALNSALEQQRRLKDEIGIFKESTKHQIKEKKKALAFGNLSERF